MSATPRHFERYYADGFNAPGLIKTLEGIPHNARLISHETKVHSYEGMHMEELRLVFEREITVTD